MTTEPLSINEWKDCSAADPAQAARDWLQRVSMIGDATRGAVFAHLPGEDELTGAWQTAVNSAGPLAGVPFLAKDLFDAAGWPTTASSTFLTEVRPTPTEDSRAVAALRKRGAVLAGKSHLNEFAYGLSGENPHFGDCPHPQAPTLLSGGSSSGSAWAVGAGIVPVALGTDTGGSIRVPASFCALYGLRLTPKHRWSREGCFPLASSFDAAGWFTRSATDMALMVDEMLPAPRQATPTNPRGLWLGDPTGAVEERYLTAMYRHADAFGVTRDPDEAATFTNAARDAAFAFNVLQTADVMAVHAEWVEPFADRYDPVVLKRILRANKWTKEERARAEAKRAEVRDAFAEIFKNYDFVVMPAVPRPAVAQHELTPEFRETLLGLNVPASLAGLPVLAVPLFLDAVRSVGLQLIFPRVDKKLIAEVLGRCV